MSESHKPGLAAFAVNRLGHPIGRGVAKGLWHSQWVRRKAAEHPELARIISEGLVAFTSLIEAGGDHPIARFANFVSETIATENLELLKEFESNPDKPGLREKVEALEGTAEAAVAKAESDGVFVAFDHIHKDKTCLPLAQYVADTTPPPRSGKDGKVVTNPSTARIVSTTMKSALASGVPLCGRCYPATSIRNAAEPEKAPTVVPGKNFMEYLMRLRKEEPREFQKFWDMYVIRLDGPDGPDLARKFQKAFNGRFSYEAFRFVIDRPHRNEDGYEEWHHALDSLLGETEPNETWKKKISGFIDEEARQTKDMFLALFAWMDKASKERSKKIDLKKAAIAKLDQEWAESRKPKPFLNVTNIVIICLAVILAAVWMIHQTDKPARSETSEQKVETPNVR